jgi:hypothetical protein
VKAWAALKNSLSNNASGMSNMFGPQGKITFEDVCCWEQVIKT